MYNFLQVFMNTLSWRMAVVKDYRLMLKTVFTVKPVISRTPVRTSTGCVPREGRDQHTMECEQSDHLTRIYCCGFIKLTLVWTSLLPVSVQIFMCHLLSVKIGREDEYSVPMFQKCSFSQGCCTCMQWYEKIAVWLLKTWNNIQHSSILQNKSSYIIVYAFIFI